MKVFVSYNHQQGDWVWQRLLPCLKAGGAEALIDRERFDIGKAVVGQMDAHQDQADKHLLVLSPDYLNSRYCKHELNRALQRDPNFNQGIVLPVMRVTCSLPASFNGWNRPLYANLEDDQQAEPWNALFRQCDANRLGTTAPVWLAARDETVRFLQRGQSVNLIAQGKANWRGLLTHIGDVHLPELAVVNLEDPDTTSRYGLLAAISRALGERAPLPQQPHDLAGFKALLTGRSAVTVALTHADLVPHRPYYDVDLFAALRFLIMESRKLVLLVQSRTSFSALLPRNHPLSDIDIKTVELRSQP